MADPIVKEPASAPKSAHIKGFAIERLFHWYAERHGEERLRSLLLAIPEDLRAPLDLEHHTFGVLASTWYPAPLVHRMLDDMTRGMSRKERAALAEAGAEAIVRTSLRGIYKVLFQLFMSPKRYADRAQALWDRYFDTGIVEKTIVGQREHASVIRDWTGHHPLLCEMNAVSGRVIYEELGCKNVRVERTGCISTGQPACTQTIVWDE